MPSDMREVQVAAFHKRIGHPTGLKISDFEHECPQCLMHSDNLAILARKLREVGPGLQEQGDPRAYRLHLMVEELEEVATAMAMGDEVALADALGDLQYVLSGTAVAFSIPLAEVFAEVHKSNLTKTQDTEDGTGRFVGKGEGYVPPDIEGAIARGRSGEVVEG